MNQLKEHFGSKLNVLGVFCNQFGHQTNEDNHEIENCLAHVRPGKGFVSAADLFGKVSVNGQGAHPLFKFLKNKLPMPCDEGVDTKNQGIDDCQALILPRGGFDGTVVATWAPVCRNDIAWNFEKFLVDADGNPYKRYSRYFSTSNIEKDISALLENNGRA